MAVVRVSAARLASLLANRGMNLENFAEGLKVDVDLESLPTVDQDLPFETVVALADRFKKTWPYLLIDAPEAKAKYGRDNRTTANQAHPLSPDLLDELLRVETLVEWAADLFPEIVAQLPTRSIGTDTPVADAAKWIRELLEVSFQEQLAANGDYGALRLWSDALQARGVYVQMRRLRDDTVRAFSFTAGEQAVIVADTGDVPYARLFSLLHEYVHIVMRSAGICDLDDQLAVEHYCNAVAAQTLMPNALMIREIPQGVRWGIAVDDDEERISRLSSRLGVSKASLLIRLREMGVLSVSTYEELEARRRLRPGRDGASGGDYHLNAITKVGRRFARRVVGAFEAGAIDRRDASTILEIPEHNFEGFRQELSKTGG